MPPHHFFPDFFSFHRRVSLLVPVLLCGSALVFLCLSTCLCHLVPASRCIPLTVCVSLYVPVTFCSLSHSSLCVTLNISVPASGHWVPPTQHPFVDRGLPLGSSINQPTGRTPLGGAGPVNLSSGPTSPFRLSLSHFLYLPRILWSLLLVLRRPFCLFLDAPLLSTPTCLFTFPGPPRGAGEKKVHLLGMGEGTS